MQLRIFLEPQQGASYDDQLAVAQTAEQLGFDALFRSDHLMRIGPGDPTPGPTESWVTLGALARETTRIRLGTMVTSATFRHPGLLAIAVAQIDAMSGGRVELGFGVGWYQTEHDAYGIPFADLGERFDRFAEQVEIVDGLWRTPLGSTYDFRGAHYTLTNSPALPKPVQSPRPPIVFGGEGRKRSATLAARFGDEYNAPFRTPEQAREIFAGVRAALEQAGRPTDSMIYSAALTVCAGRDEAEVAKRAAAIGRGIDDLRHIGLAGTSGEIVDRIGQFADLGVTRIYLQVMDMADLDHLAFIASEIAPQLPS